MPARSISTVIKQQHLLVAVAKTSVSEAARLMEKHQVGAVMVVDARGQLSGIFTERDALGPELQEFESEVKRREQIGEVLG